MAQSIIDPALTGFDIDAFYPANVAWREIGSGSCVARYGWFAYPCMGGTESGIHRNVHPPERQRWSFGGHWAT
jgi:hypothetical protein